jgi:hypothetical protein
MKTISSMMKPASGPYKGKIIEVSDSNPLFGTGYIGFLPSSSGASLTEANNRASAAIFKAIRASFYQISGPTFLGELRESLQMIRRPAASLQKSFGAYMTKIDKNLGRIGRLPPSTRFVRDGLGNWQPIGKNANRTESVRKMLADTWLEYSFGWSPLVSDIKSGAIALARFGTDIRRDHVSAVGVHENVTSDATNILATAPGIVSLHWTDRHQIRVSYKVGLQASMNVPSGTPDRLIELCGFSWQNFAPTVWELLPWSFLVDYFVNINSVLEAYTTDTANVTWASKFTKTASLRRIDYHLDVPATKAISGDVFVMANRPDGGYYESEVSTGTRTSGLTYPTLTFKLPDLPRQVGNMAALFLAQGRMRTNSFL